jgi:hypothetical protein
MLERTVRALSPRHPVPDDFRIALALDQVWFAAFVGWATGIESSQYILDSVEAAAQLLVRARSGED